MNPTSDNARMPGWLESAWLARYFDRQLSVEEAAWLEAYLLDKPELLAVVEADTTLRDALMAERASGAALAGAGDARTGPVGDAAPARARSAIAWLPLAASLLLGIGIGYVGLRASSPPDAATPFVANPARIIFDTMRGIAPERAREEPGDPDSPILLLEVSIPPGSEVVGAEVEIDGRHVALPLPKVSSEGFATFAVPAKWRQHGKLVVSLGGEEGAAPHSSVSFAF